MSLNRKLSKVFEIEERSQQIVHITIPSNYQALLGPLIWKKYRIPYIVDYIDPWVPESDQEVPFGSKLWASYFLAKHLEPIAVRYASGLAGVTKGYFQSVIKRNPHLTDVPQIAFQYGCSSLDHEKARQVRPLIQKKRGPERQIVYAGALLPKAIEPMRCFLKALAAVNRTYLKERPIHLICIGTGKSPNDPHGYQVLPLACTEGAQEWVQEYPERHPYLEVLATLAEADGITIIGSTEPHYSPSKIFQAVLARRPVLALLHQESQGVQILNSSGAGRVITFNSSIHSSELVNQCTAALLQWPTQEPPLVKWEWFEPFSASSIASQVASFYERVLAFAQNRA